MARYFTPANVQISKPARNSQREEWSTQQARFIADVQEPAFNSSPIRSQVGRHSEHWWRTTGLRAGRSSGSTATPDSPRTRRPTKPTSQCGLAMRRDLGSCTGALPAHRAGSLLRGAGLWRPEAPLARTIRRRSSPTRGVGRRPPEQSPSAPRFTTDGDSLVRPPPGFDPEHPLIEDLKRRTSPRPPPRGTTWSPPIAARRVHSICKTAAPFISF